MPKTAYGVEIATWGSEEGANAATMTLVFPANEETEKWVEQYCKADNISVEKRQIDNTHPPQNAYVVNVNLLHNAKDAPSQQNEINNTIDLLNKSIENNPLDQVDGLYEQINKKESELKKVEHQILGRPFDEALHKNALVIQNDIKALKMQIDKDKNTDGFKYENIPANVIPNWEAVIKHLDSLLDPANNKFDQSSQAKISNSLKMDLDIAFFQHAPENAGPMMQKMFLQKNNWQQNHVKEKDGTFDTISKDEAQALRTHAQNQIDKSKKELESFIPTAPSLMQVDPQYSSASDKTPDNFTSLKINNNGQFADGMKHGLDVKTMLQEVQKINSQENKSLIVEQILQAGTQEKTLKESLQTSFQEAPKVDNKKSEEEDKKLMLVAPAQFKERQQFYSVMPILGNEVGQLMPSYSMHEPPKAELSDEQLALGLPRSVEPKDVQHNEGYLASKEEREFILQQFKDNPTLQEVTDKTVFPEGHPKAGQKITCNAFKDNHGNIYLMNPTVLGQGSFGTVKVIQAIQAPHSDSPVQNKEFYVVKIQNVKQKGDEQTLRVIRQEMDFNKDTKLHFGEMVIRHTVLDAPPRYALVAAPKEQEKENDAKKASLNTGTVQNNVGTTQIQNPGTTQIQNPGTTQIQNPGTTQIQNAGTTQIQNPGTTQIQNPGTTQIQNAGTTQLQNASTTQSPKKPYMPGTTQYQTGTSQYQTGTIQSPKKPYMPGTTQYQTGTSQYQTGTTQYQTGTSQYQTGTTQYQTGTSQYQTGTSQSPKKPYMPGTTQYQTGTSQYQTGTTQSPKKPYMPGTTQVQNIPEPTKVQPKSPRSHSIESPRAKEKIETSSAPEKEHPAFVKMKAKKKNSKYKRALIAGKAALLSLKIASGDFSQVQQVIKLKTEQKKAQNKKENVPTEPVPQKKKSTKPVLEKTVSFARINKPRFEAAGLYSESISTPRTPRTPRGGANPFAGFQYAGKAATQEASLPSRDQKSTLNEMIAQQKPPELITPKQDLSAFKPDEFLTYFEKMAQEIETIHAKGILHRDIKAENFLYDPRTGVMKAIDFGLARRMNDPELKAPYYMCEGSPHNFAPEHFQKDYQEKISTKQDIYALGRTFGLLMAGEILKYHPTAYKEGVPSPNVPSHMKEEIAQYFLENFRFKNDNNDPKIKAMNDILDVIHKMTNLDVKSRPEATEVKVLIQKLQQDYKQLLEAQAATLASAPKQVTQPAPLEVQARHSVQPPATPVQTPPLQEPSLQVQLKQAPKEHHAPHHEPLMVPASTIEMPAALRTMPHEAHHETPIQHPVENGPSNFMKHLSKFVAENDIHNLNHLLNLGIVHSHPALEDKDWRPRPNEIAKINELLNKVEFNLKQARFDPTKTNDRAQKTSPEDIDTLKEYKVAFKDAYDKHTTHQAKDDVFLGAEHHPQDLTYFKNAIAKMDTLHKSVDNSAKNTEQEQKHVKLNK